MYYFEKESLNKINTGASSNFEVQESLLADRDSYYLALDKYKADLLAFEKHQEKVKEKKKQDINYLKLEQKKISQLLLKTHQ